MFLVLISAGADPNVVEKFGFTPLHLAAYLGHAAMVSFLVDNGGDVRRENNQGSTPLHLACKSGNKDVVAEPTEQS